MAVVSFTGGAGGGSPKATVRQLAGALSKEDYLAVAQLMPADERGELTDELKAAATNSKRNGVQIPDLQVDVRDDSTLLPHACRQRA